MNQDKFKIGNNLLNNTVKNKSIKKLEINVQIMGTKKKGDRNGI